VTPALTGHDRTQQTTIDFVIHRSDTFSEQHHANAWNFSRRKSATQNAVRFSARHFNAVSSISFVTSNSAWCPFQQLRNHRRSPYERGLISTSAFMKKLRAHCLSVCYHHVKYILYAPLLSKLGPGSSVGIAIDCELNGPGIDSRWRRDFSHTSRPALGPTQPPVQWVPGLSRG
jgi:hypothetical protein